MKFAFFKGAVAAIAVAATTMTANAAEWTPSGPIKMMIAFRAGGGVDTMGRLLAEELSARQGWEIIPENVTGKGGGTLAVALKDEPADGLAIGMTVDESMTYGVQASRNPGYELEDFDYLAAITGTQMGVIAKSSRGWKTLGDVIAAAKAGEKITFGAMSPMLADAIYIIGKKNDVEFTSVMVKGGKGGLNGVVADDLDVAWAAGVQTPGVKSGDLINLVSAEETPLRISPDAPMMSEFNVPYIFGSSFILVAPDGLPAEAKEAYISAVSEILNDPESKVSQFANRAFSGPSQLVGEDLTKAIFELYDSYSTLLEDSAE